MVIALPGAFAAHLPEIGVYGLAAHGLVQLAGLGALAPAGAPDLGSALYFSASTCTSLG